MLTDAFFLYWRFCFWMALALCLFLYWRYETPWTGQLRPSKDNLDRLTAFFASAVMLAFANFILYLAIPDFRDYGEPVIPILASNLLNGTDVYGPPLYEMSVQLLEGKREFAKRVELRELFSAFPHAEMGHGDGPRDSADEYYRAQRAFLGQSTRFDYVNFADQRMAGAGLAPMHSLPTGCKVPAWIFGRSGGHFTGKAYGIVELFDDEVRNLFGSDYRLTRIGNFYEVWTCQ